jgi:hypothetical protein
MTDVIDRIQRKLAYLRQYEDFDNTDADNERKSQVSHIKDWAYELEPPLTETEVSAFEAQYGIRLPQDYRRFVLEVGSRGACPTLTMLSIAREEDMIGSTRLDALFEEDGDELIDYEDAYPLGDLQAPFPLTTAVGEAEQDQLIEQYGDAILTMGNIPVAFGGCQCWYLLIITGEARGQVWYEDLPIYTPVLLADGRIYHRDWEEDDEPSPFNAHPATFTAWYEAWLDEQIMIAYPYWRKRGRDVPACTE